MLSLMLHPKIPFLNAHNISYTYPRSSSQAYSHMSFTLNRGELLCLAGINGSGKTSLLYSLAGLYPPTEGSFSFSDDIHADILVQSEKLRQLSALVAQEAELQIFGSTIAEDIELTLKSTHQNPRNLPKNIEMQQEKARTLLAFFNLSHKSSLPIQNLSYGEKRKLCLVNAFIRQPSLLLLDEPFSGLDYPACLEVVAFIRQALSDNTSIVVSTHDLDLIYVIAHKVLFLSPTLPFFFGTPAEGISQFSSYSLKPLTI